MKIVAMSPLLRCCIRLIIWGLTLTGTLSIANLPGDWGHSVCGAWGCGPPLQALVACHLSWLVVIIPIAMALRRFCSASLLRRMAAGALVLAVTGILGIILHEYLTWFAQASEWQRPFFWHRVGFVILTTVELPIIEIAALACALLPRLHALSARLAAHDPGSCAGRSPESDTGRVG